MKLTTGYKKPIASSGTDAQEQSSNNSYLLLAGGGHKALSDFATKEYVQTYVGNGRLILKNGDTIISNDFTANKDSDTTIDLNTIIQVDNPFNDPEDDDEDNIEISDDPYKNAKQLGSITLKFWNQNTATYTLPVYDVSVLPLATVKEPIGTLSYYCEIFLVIGITDSSIVDDIGFTSGSYKYFYIRGANIKNKVCESFDVRGNGNTNTANACITGGYLHLQCSLKLHGGDSGTGNDIMQKAAAGDFSAYFCLRQTP